MTIFFRLFFYHSFLTTACWLQAQQPITKTDTIAKTDTIKYVGLEKQIDSIIHVAINKEAFPGCVVYAAREDSVLFHKSYGFHTYDSIRKVKEDDIYDLASITKIAGATLALMKLYDDGIIHLDEPINSYVDIGGQFGKVTIREALAHQGGIRPWIPYHQEIRKKDGTFRTKDMTSVRDDRHEFEITDQLYLSNQFYTKRIKKMIRKSPVIKDPGYKYSGLFFYLVPELVETQTGSPFDQFLEDQFLQYLQNPTFGFKPSESYSLDRIPPTELDTFFRNQLIHGKVHDEGAIMMKGISGNAGLFSNAEDLSKVMQLLLAKGNVDTLRLLSPQTIDLFTTAQYPNLENRRGLGFDKPLLKYDSVASSVARDASERSFGHSGYTGTLTWADPDNGLIFIFLSNRVYPTRNHRALYELNVRPTIHQLLYDYLQKNG